MSILMLTGSASGLTGIETLERLRVHCAGLVRKQLRRCLAMLPATLAERECVLGFLMELKRAAPIQTVGLIKGPELSALALADCCDAGLDEVLILQGAEDPEPAIAEMLRFREARAAGMPYRLWLDPAADGRMQSASRSWRHYCPNPLSVEVAPFGFEKETFVAGLLEQERIEVPCGWRQAVTTVDSYATLLPCPAHPPSAGVGLGQGTVRTAAGICAACPRLVRFALPDWMTAVPAANAGAPARSHNGRHYDAVGGELSQLSAADRENLIAEWLERVQASARQGGAQ